MTWDDAPPPATDEERQAQALRRRLDHELAGVRATAQARERLIRTTTARARSEHEPTRMPRRLRPVLALPLAGALVAAVIAGAVVVPTFLRSETEPIAPAGGGGPLPAVSTPAATTAPPKPGPAPTPTPSQASAPRTTPGAASVPTRTPALEPSRLRVIASPAVPQPGQRIVLTVRGAPARHGRLTVNWGDRSAETTVSGSCGARDAQPAQPAESTEVGPVSHSYPRAGRYRVTMTLDQCGTRGQADVTLVVQEASSPVPSR